MSDYVSVDYWFWISTHEFSEFSSDLAIFTFFLNNCRRYSWIRHISTYTINWCMRLSNWYIDWSCSQEYTSPKNGHIILTVFMSMNVCVASIEQDFFGFTRESLFVWNCKKKYKNYRIVERENIALEHCPTIKHT